MVGTIKFYSTTKFSYRYMEISAYDCEHYSHISDRTPSIEYIVDIFNGFIDTKIIDSNAKYPLLSSSDITNLYISSKKIFIQNPLYPKFRFKIQNEKFELKPIKRMITKNPPICVGNMFLNRGLYVKVLAENKCPIELSLICDALNHAFMIITNTSVRLFYPAPSSIYADISPFTDPKFGKAVLPYLAKRNLIDEFKLIKAKYALDISEVPTKLNVPRIREFEITNSVDFVVKACDEYRLMKYLISKYVAKSQGGKRFDTQGMEYVLNLPTDDTVQKYVSECRIAFDEVMQNLHKFGYFESKQIMQYAFARELLAMCNDNSVIETMADTIFARKYAYVNSEFPGFLICDKYFDGVNKETS